MHRSGETYAGDLLHAVKNPLGKHAAKAALQLFIDRALRHQFFKGLFLLLGLLPAANTRRATVEWCAARFDHVEVCVSDTSQRYNIMFDEGLDEAAAFKKSLEAGNGWIARHAPMLKALPKYHMKRWEDWRARPDFKDRLMSVMQAYDGHSAFRQSIDGTVMQAWERKSKSAGIMDAARRSAFIDLSYRYILEELAVFSMRFEDFHAIDVYPGTGIAAIMRHQDVLPESLPRGLTMQYLCSIKLSHNKNAANAPREPLLTEAVAQQA